MGRQGRRERRRVKGSIGQPRVSLLHSLPHPFLPHPRPHADVKSMDRPRESVPGIAGREVQRAEAEVTIPETLN